MPDSVVPPIEHAPKYIQRLNDYRKTITQLYPSLAQEHVHHMSIKDDEALAIARFLDLWPREMVVVEIGTFVGVSAFHFAGQQKVVEVLSIDPNPSLTELGAEWDLDWEDERVHAVAAKALAHFPEQAQKVRLLEGTAEDVELTATTSSATLVAFVDGDHSKTGVQTDLRAVFAKHRCSMAILHDCRKPAVLAAALAFVAASPGEFDFRYLKHDDSEEPKLGIIHTRAVSEAVDRVAAGMLYSPVEAMAWAAARLSKVWEQQTVNVVKQQQHVRRLEARLLETKSLKDHYQKRADRLRVRLQTLRDRKRAKRQRHA